MNAFKDLAMTSTVAGCVMVGVLSLFGSGIVDATDEAAEPATTPSGVEVRIDNATHRARPSARLTLVNTRNIPVEVRGELALYAEAPGSEMSRMATAPREVWHENCLYVLAPGETKEVVIRAKKRVPKRSTAFFTFNTEEIQLASASFVPGRKARPAPALALLAPSAD